MKKNRGTRGDSLLILGSTEPLSKKPPLQAEWVSGGSMSLVSMPLIKGNSGDRFHDFLRMIKKEE